MKSRLKIGWTKVLLMTAGLLFSSSISTWASSNMVDQAIESSSISVLTNSKDTLKKDVPVAGLNVTINAIEVTCFNGNNGSATAVVTPSHPPYTYLWNTGATTATISNLTAGNYTVTVTKATTTGTLTGTATVTITQPPQLMVTVTNTSVCGALLGSANASPFGGTPGYRYLWNTGARGNSINNVPPGNYSVIVTDANGCAVDGKVVVTLRPAVTATTSSTPTACHGGQDGTATVIAHGTVTTTAGYTYIWSNGATTSTINNLAAGTYTVTVADANGCTVTTTVAVTQPSAIIATARRIVNVSCYGGSDGRIIMAVRGGTPGYTYLWSPGGQTTLSPSNLSAATYTLVVTDANGCKDTATTTITQPNKLAVSATSTAVTCSGGNDGTATANAIGGTTPYTYSWSNGETTSTATGLIAGTYTVNVNDANNCGPVSTTVTIGTLHTLTVTTISQTNVTCNGLCNGSATVQASTNSPVAQRYTYRWAPRGGTAATATGLCAGTYVVTVHDLIDGCTATDTIIITQPPVLTASTTVVNICHKGGTGSATVTAGGGTPSYKYSWAPSGGTNATASNLSAGTYTVTVTDANGCTVTATATIAVSNLAITLVTHGNVSCNGLNDGSARFNTTGGRAPYSYLWNPGGYTSFIENHLYAGTYTVTVTDANGCQAKDSVTITQPPALTVSVVSTTPCGATRGSASATPSGGTAPYNYTWSNGATTSSISNLLAGTYSVTVHDAHGCPATGSVVITLPSALSLTVSHTNEMCNGGTNASATVSAGTTGTSPYTYSWAPSGGTNATASNLSAGTYTVTVTDAHGCTASASVTITQPSAVIVSINSALPNINVSCNGGHNGAASVMATGGTPGYTYSWNTSPVQTGVTATNLSAGTYVVTATDSKGCTGTYTVTITQPSVLTASITAQTNVTCSGGNNGSASVTAGGGTSPYTYSWSNGVTTSSVSNLAVGTYTVSVNDANHCGPVTATVTITQPTALSATISSQTNVSCHGGNNGSAAVTATGGTSPYTYSWSNGATTSSVSGLAFGSYTVSVSDANHCGPVTLTVNINQPAILVASLISKTNVTCNGGNNGSAIVSAGGGTAPYTYSWSPGGGTNSTETGLSAGTYTVTVDDANHCGPVTTTVTIAQPSAVSVGITLQTNVNCYGANTGTATVSASGGNGGPYTYSWNTSPVQTGATASNLSAGTYTVTATDANGCTGTATVTITQPSAALSASITSQTNVGCNGGNNGSATVTASGGTAPYTYSWSNGQTTSTATNLTAGTYTVSVNDANNCGPVTTTVTITQFPQLTLTTSSQTNVTCFGACNGTATVSAGGGRTHTRNPYTYTWSPSGGTNSTATNLCAGAYTVTVTDLNGCTATDVITITQPNQLAASITSQTNVGCSGGNTGSATVTATGGTAPYTYSWSPSGGNGATANNLSAGTYTVTVNDAHSCGPVTATVTITQTASTVSVSATSTPGCGGSTGSATASASGGTAPYSYSWAPSGGNNATANNLAAGTYTVTATDANGCSGSTTVVVNVYSSPSVTVTPPSATINEGNNVSLTATGSGGTSPYTFSWQPASGLSATVGATVVASPTVTTTYTVTINDANGVCSSTATVTITVIPSTVQTPTSCDTCLGGLNLIPGKTYLVSVWTKVTSAVAGDTTYTTPQLTITFGLYPSGNTSFGPFSPQGRIIDGWQRIESQFTVPATANSFNIILSCLSGQCNFDDIRVFPFNGTLKTYVYDPNTLRLAAVLDERNYATIYEYDEEGKLIRVKKETERGVMTIQESRTSMQKQ